MEGLEWVATVNLHLTYKLTNNTINALTNNQVKTLAKEREQQIASSLGGKDSDGNQVNVTFSQSDKATISWEYNMAFDFSRVEGAAGLNTDQHAQAEVGAQGVTDKIGDTQNNKTQINVGLTSNMEWTDQGQINFENKERRSELAIVGSHEDGHVLGLKHTATPKNLMLPGDTGKGTQVTPSQRTQAIESIEKQQKKSQ